MLNSFSALSTKVMTRQGTGVHTDLNVAAGGLTKSFLEIRLPYVRLVHYPGSAPAQEGLSKMAVIRAIRTTVERNLGQDEKANVEYLEALIIVLVGNPPPLEGSSSEEDNEDDTNTTKEELEKRKALVQQVKEEYEAMAKLLKKKEALFKEARDSLQDMRIGISQTTPPVSNNSDKGKPPVNQSIHALSNILRIKDFFTIARKSGNILLAY